MSKPLALSTKEYLEEADIICVCKYHKRILEVNESYNLMHPKLAAIVLDSSGLVCPGYSEWENQHEDVDPETEQQEYEKCADSWEWLFHPTKEELAQYLRA